MRLVQDSKIVVGCVVVVTEGFKVGLGSGISYDPLVVCSGEDRLTDGTRQESPWALVFADAIVICSRAGRRWKREACSGQNRNESP